ncbi:hypothetical protein EG68_09924 [Paragonimus skrjabini miyazakii]|uniref:Translation machinery-associated protein 16 n=1 Tax=Paragonimus skrjabini miyazakii TaxID=59628 RepID=A0A8S9YKJ3_9TREM|nr:hypothetical protein EG68_09924 [Paragonimus skrjabini miyazakii]
MKTVHPNSRKAGQVRKRLHHDQRVLRRQKQHTMRNKHLESKLQWFRDNFPKDRVYLSHNEQLALTEQYLQQFHTLPFEEPVPVAFDITNAFLKQENEEYSSCGVQVPDLTSKANVEKLLSWDGNPASMLNIRLNVLKKKKKSS